MSGRSIPINLSLLHHETSYCNRNDTQKDILVEIVPFGMVMGALHSVFMQRTTPEKVGDHRKRIYLKVKLLGGWCFLPPLPFFMRTFARIKSQNHRHVLLALQIR